MHYPIRCFTCNKAIGEQGPLFQHHAIEQQVVAPVEMAQILGLTRYCCRRSVFLHQQLIEIQLGFRPPLVSVPEAADDIEQIGLAAVKAARAAAAHPRVLSSASGSGSSRGGVAGGSRAR